MWCLVHARLSQRPWNMHSCHQLVRCSLATVPQTPPLAWSSHFPVFFLFFLTGFSVLMMIWTVRSALPRSDIAVKPWLAASLSDLMNVSGRHICLSGAIGSNPSVHSEAKALTWRNQEVLIGGGYCLHQAQVSTMRRLRGPALPGAPAKWDENTINCQGQLKHKCIRPAWPMVSMFATLRIVWRNVKILAGPTERT